MRKSGFSEEALFVNDFEEISTLSEKYVNRQKVAFVCKECGKSTAKPLKKTKVSGFLLCKPHI